MLLLLKVSEPEVPVADLQKCRRPALATRAMVDVGSRLSPGSVA